LQFPWRRWLPNSLNSLHFYPVMFGLWISFIQDQHLSALSRVARDSEDSGDDDSLSENSGSGARSIERQNIRNSSLQFSRSIAECLDDLLSSFPYSDSHTLWNIRAMVAQWMGDLSTEKAGLDQEDEEEVNENGGVQLAEQEDGSSRRHAKPIAAKNALDHRPEGRKRYMEIAKSAFEREANLKDQSKSRNELSGED